MEIIMSLLNLFKKMFGYADLNDDGKLDVQDVKVAAAKVEAKVEAGKAEAKKRVKRVKEEAGDVKKAVKKTVKQVKDVAEAAAGKERAGRKKK
jgi:FtsZ-interacting cell division protein YlmF